MDKLTIIVYTPEGKKYESVADFIQVRTSNAYLGILPNHSPLISDVIISKCLVRKDTKDEAFAVGSGMIYVENGTVKLLVESFESKAEINLERALASKQRAEERLSNLSDEIDVNRAKASLARALNRIDIYNN